MERVSHGLVLALNNLLVTTNDVLGVLLEKARRFDVEVEVAFDSIRIVIHSTYQMPLLYVQVFEFKPLLGVLEFVEDNFANAHTLVV